MHVKVAINPMPAVRMTQKTMYYGAAEKYVAYKNDLAQELKLSLDWGKVGKIKGSIFEIEDPPKKIFDEITKEQRPYFLGPVYLEVKFYRDSNINTDIDNLLKAVMDVLQTAQVIYNDDQVRKVKAEMFKGCEKGSFEFTLKSYNL